MTTKISWVKRLWTRVVMLVRYGRKEKRWEPRIPLERVDRKRRLR